VSDESTCSLDNLLEFLLELAGPGLFRANAFRVVGLSAHAAEKEIRKQVDKLQFMVRNPGNAGPTPGPLPLDPPPGDETVGEAAQQLRDPERRFIDEFFWFWPQPGLGNKDPALAALSNRDVEVAIEIWTGEARRKDDHGRSAHNLAVMFHTLALDIECAKQTETISKKLGKVQYTYWHKGLAQWQAVLADEEFWNQLNARVLELNDPRLTSVTARQLRMALPLILLMINAQIVAQCSARGAGAEAKQYRRLMQESGFAEDLVEEACGRAARQLRDLISTICKTAEQEADRDPATADEGAARLLQQSGPLLVAIDMLMPSGVAMGDEARDEVATAATNCLLLLRDELAKSEVARKLLEQTRPYAVSLAVRERIDFLRAEFLRSAYKVGKS
jgi:hypothetical protein